MARRVRITVQTAFPGTPLYRRVREEGRLLRDGAWELCTLFDVNFQPSAMSVSELERALRDLAGRLYDAGATRNRRARFRSARPRSGAVSSTH